MYGRTLLKCIKKKKLNKNWKKVKDKLINIMQNDDYADDDNNGNYVGHILVNVHISNIHM